MEHEKLDTTLNLSVETEKAVRQKSEVLSSGVNEEAGTWEVIVKYHGDISAISELAEAVDVLVNNYAIMTVTKEQLAEIVQSEQIEFVELPKSMQYNTYRAKQASCILLLTRGETALSGSGVLVACIDSGIDYLLRDFQNADGSRILYLWDQTLNEEGRTFDGFLQGAEFTKADIDRAIAAANEGNPAGSRYSIEQYNRAWGIVPSLDVTGHGTAVAGIAAGSSISPLYQGIAQGSDLIIVKLKGNTLTEGGGLDTDNSGTSQGSRVGSNQNFPLTTDLMRGISYVVQKAEQLGRPVVINLSIGDTYGAHEPCN